MLAGAQYATRCGTALFTEFVAVGKASGFFTDDINRAIKVREWQEREDRRLLAAGRAVRWFKKGRWLWQTTTSLSATSEGPYEPMSPPYSPERSDSDSDDTEREAACQYVACKRTSEKRINNRTVRERQIWSRVTTQIKAGWTREAAEQSGHISDRSRLEELADAQYEALFNTALGTGLVRLGYEMWSFQDLLVLANGSAE